MAAQPDSGRTTEQIVSQLLSKALHAILAARIPYIHGPTPPPSRHPRKRDRWFHLALGDPPPPLEHPSGLIPNGVMEPLVVDILLTPRDDHTMPEAIVERWLAQCEAPAPWSPLHSPAETSSNSFLVKRTYKKSIILLRSIYSVLRLLPAQRVFKMLCASNQSYNYDLTYRVSSFAEPFPRKEEAEFQYLCFAPVETQSGQLAVSVQYRPSLSQFNLEISSPLLEMLPEITDYVSSPAADLMRALPFSPSQRIGLQSSTLFLIRKHGQPSTFAHASATSLNRSHSWSGSSTEGLFNQAQPEYHLHTGSLALNFDEFKSPPPFYMSPAPSAPKFSGSYMQSPFLPETAPVSIPQFGTSNVKGFHSPNLSDLTHDFLPPPSPRSVRRTDPSSHDSDSRSFRRPDGSRISDCYSNMYGTPKSYAPSGDYITPMEETELSTPREEQLSSDSDAEDLDFVSWTCLENVKTTELEKKKNICKKPKITSVTLHWTTSLDRSREATVPDDALLEKLQPHSNLQHLKLDGYMARELASWLMNINSHVPNLVQLNLCNLAKCDHLPPLGQLKKLSELRIWNLPNLKKINNDFFGGGEALSQLKFFSLGHMLNLEEWEISSVAKSGEDMPLLFINKLEVIRCPKLVFWPFLPASNHFTIEESANALSFGGYSRRPTVSFLYYLKIRDCGLSFDGWNQLQLVNGLKEMLIDSCRDLNTLPESMRSLSSLESLDITSCKNIAWLPEWMGDLLSLRVLHIQDCYNLSRLPDCLQNLSSLKSLRVVNCSSMLVARCMREEKIKIAHIPRVFIEEDGGQEIYWSISELSTPREGQLSSDSDVEDLDFISWTCLENVKTTELEKKKIICSKPKIFSVTLHWTTSLDRSGEATVPDDALLEKLQPHSNLQHLKLDGYMARELASWLMNINSHLPNLVQLNLSNLAKCDHLPPLGQLKKLSELRIWNLPNLKKINNDFFGCGEALSQLTILSLGHMLNLEEWEISSVAKSGEDMPLLFINKLEVIRCPKLVFKPFLPASNNFTIEESTNALSSGGYSGRPTVSSLYYLKIRDCGLSFDGWNQLQLVNGLKEMLIDSCQDLNTLPESMRSLTSLESLDITSCKNIAWLPEWLGDLLSLRVLHIQDCYNLSRLPDCLQNLSSLKSLRVVNCSSMLVARCMREEKIKIAHIPRVFIEEDGGQEIYWNNIDLVSTTSV